MRFTLYFANLVKVVFEADAGIELGALSPMGRDRAAAAVPPWSNVVFGAFNGR